MQFSRQSPVHYQSNAYSPGYYPQRGPQARAYGARDPMNMYGQYGARDPMNMYGQYGAQYGLQANAYGWDDPVYPQNASYYYRKPSAAYASNRREYVQPRGVHYVTAASKAGQRQVEVVERPRSFVGEIVLSCIVLWCCNCLFGLIAFILAVVAGNTAVSDPLKARNLGRAALGMAIAGIIVSVLFVFIAFIVLPYGFNIPVFGLTY